MLAPARRRKNPQRFALVLLDLSMPLMDGEETFHQLRAIEPTVPVLLNTGFIEKHRLERMMAAGLSGFLCGPYRPNDVVEHIESVLATRDEKAASGAPPALIAPRLFRMTAPGIQAFDGLAKTSGTTVEIRLPVPAA